jgi:hypothetical protein
LTTDLSGSAAAISRAILMPATSAATSSGSLRELVRMRGFSPGSALRNLTQPRERGVMRTGPVVSAWPSNSSAPCSTK